MGEIFRELQEESKERETRAAFERWMAGRGTPLPLEHPQAYEAFKAGMERQSCMTAVRMFQTEGAALAQPKTELRDQHKAFAEWFLQQNPIAPNVEDMAWAAWKAALAQPETEAEPVAWMHENGKVLSEFAMKSVRRDFASFPEVFRQFSIPLYAHPPRDEWRLASEPPEDGRDVVVWMDDGDGNHGTFAIGRCFRGHWSPHYIGSPVTHWRDVQPPTEGSK